jgi:hypothetical protein
VVPLCPSFCTWGFAFTPGTNSMQVRTPAGVLGLNCGTEVLPGWLELGVEYGLSGPGWVDLLQAQGSVLSPPCRAKPILGTCQGGKMVYVPTMLPGPAQWPCQSQPRCLQNLFLLLWPPSFSHSAKKSPCQLLFLSALEHRSNTCVNKLCGIQEVGWNIC